MSMGAFIVLLHAPYNPQSRFKDAWVQSPDCSKIDTRCIINTISPSRAPF